MSLTHCADPRRRAEIFALQRATNGVRDARKVEALYGLRPEQAQVEEWQEILLRHRLRDERLQVRLLRILSRWRSTPVGDQTLALYRAARAEAEGDL